jgi:hypothetical protein
MGSKFVQESCIGYNGGSIISVGIADLARQSPTEDVEMSDMSEESKEVTQSHLD